MNCDSLGPTPTQPTQQLPGRPWAQLHFDTLELFTVHFPSDNKLLTAAYSASTAQSRLFIEHSVLKRTRDRKTSFKTEEQLHILTRLPEQSLLWFKVSPEQVRVHYSWGRPFGAEWLGGKVWRLYTSFSATRSLNSPSFKVGLLGTSPFSGSFLDARVRYNVGEFSHEQYFYLKGGWEWQRLSVGAMAAVDVRRRLLQRNGLKVGWELGEGGWLGAQLEVDNYRNYKMSYRRLGSYFDMLRLAYVHYFQEHRWTGGLQCQYNLESSETRKIEAVIQFRPSPPVTSGFELVKARISSSLEMALASSYVYSELARGCVGVQWAKANWRPASLVLSAGFGRE